MNGQRLQRGVSLIEALAALAVMAFGLLGVVGMQGTLRANSDAAKQRAEAVRIAQAAMEDWRGFEQIGASGTVADFQEIATHTAIASTGNNATFRRSATVAPATLDASTPKVKTVQVKVAWEDRSGNGNEILLVSSIAGISPELAGSLRLPTDRGVAHRPKGRALAIPPQAITQTDGTSRFTVPNSGNTVWVFNNATGIITSVCDSSGSCTLGDKFLISGFVAFATGAAPTPPEAELPTDSPVTGLGLKVTTTFPASTADELCFTEAVGSFRLAYYCAAPASVTAPRLWSGSTQITGIPIAGTLAGDSAAEFKVCRYTPATSDTPPGGNAAHPLAYVNLNGALTNQNFLVISAGNAPPPAATVAASYACPLDDTSTNFINTTTYRHQPLS